jgi:hypothetical protein
LTAFGELDNRIKIFTSLRLEALDRIALQRQLDPSGNCIRNTSAQQGDSGCRVSPVSQSALNAGGRRRLIR